MINVRTEIRHKYEHLERIVDHLFVPQFSENKTCRKRKYVYMRYIIAAILKQHGATTTEIGVLIGKKDHSAACYAMDVHWKNMTHQDTVSKTYQDIYVALLDAFERGKYVVPRRTRLATPYVYPGLSIHSLQSFEKNKKWTDGIYFF